MGLTPQLILGKMVTLSTSLSLLALLSLSALLSLHKLRRTAPQDRLIALVAGHLLDSNSEERLGSGVTEEYRTNLAQNLADAIDLLPKLVRSRMRATVEALNPTSHVQWCRQRSRHPASCAGADRERMSHE